MQCKDFDPDTLTSICIAFNTLANYLKNHIGEFATQHGSTKAAKEYMKSTEGDQEKIWPKTLLHYIMCLP